MVDFGGESRVLPSTYILLNLLYQVFITLVVNIFKGRREKKSIEYVDFNKAVNKMIKESEIKI